MINLLSLGNNKMGSSYVEKYEDLYHGTLEEYAREIVATQKFVPSKEGWCGKGIYFYDNKAKAWWSANRTRENARRKGNVGAVADIVIADIKQLARSCILDLRSPEDLEKFANFVNQFLKDDDFKIETKDGKEEKKIKRAMLLSFYCKENNIKLIIGYFQQQSRDRIETLKPFADTWQLAIGIETIYCAKEPTIVCNIRRRELL